VRHAFRVAAGLDSMVLGEPQILGQVKESVRNAENSGTLGQMLGGVFRKTFSVAKQVRSETALGGESISMAAAALKLAQNIFGRPVAHEHGAGRRGRDGRARRDVLRGAASVRGQGRQPDALARRGIRRALRRHGDLARRAPDHLHEFDIVVTGTASTLPILGKGMFERALKARRRRPIFVVDFAVPRDVEPEVSRLEDVFLYTIDDLGGVVTEGREKRRAAVADAEAIVEAQVRAYREWQTTRAAAPAIVELRRRADQYREAELAKARARLARVRTRPASWTRSPAASPTNSCITRRRRCPARPDSEREQLARAIEALYPDIPEREPGDS
jgi:glutamyl-tRNA reductase